MFFDQFTALCNERGVRPTTLMRKIGISPSMPKRWAEGAQPKADALQKIADYFDVPVSHLLSESKPQNVNNVKDSVIMQGSYGNNMVANGSMRADVPTLTEQEAEMLRIFRGLNMRYKNKALTTLYELEDECSGN